MKKLLLTVFTTVILGCFLGKAQVSRSNGFPTNANPQTQPINISQFEASGRLITQNAFAGPLAIPAAQQTGSFLGTARWNSMGSLNAGSQILNGFRTQTDGRALTTGFSVPTGGTVSNPTIQWIGNAAPGVNVTPGNLEFKYANSPGSPGNPQLDFPIFTMKPKTAFAPSFNYAEKDALVGQLQTGTLGSFLTADTWSATGAVTTPSFETYGARHQYNGYTFNSGLLRDLNTNQTNAVIDFGSNISAGVGSYVFKFRSFRDPLDQNSVKNIWQSSNKFNNIVLGRQNYFNVNSAPFYLSLFDGQASNTSLQAQSIGKAGIYATTDGKDEFGAPLISYASIIGEVENPISDFGQRRFAIAGFTGGNSNGNIYAGYFLGDAVISGTLFNPSDRKFKKQINDEAGMLTKLMKLQPKNYLFDTEKFNKMAFSPKLQHGLISQEVELIFPELVQDIPTIGDEKNSTYKAVNYVGLITVLTKSIQELNVKVVDLEIKLANSASVANTIVLKENAISSSEKLLLENKSFSLSQNIPNPFTESTTISYTIPQNVSKALLAIFDLNGKMLLQYNLQLGKNQVIINGSQLTAGMYIYSLIADGAEVVSKRMILTK